MNYVLMSTYNGEKYVTEQIDSIVNQKWIGKCKVVIRDDGSSDNTINILLENKKKYEFNDVELEIIEGENIGVIQSFHFLCNSISTNNNDLVFFSDQDDVWLQDRFDIVSSVFDKENIDLYCSALLLVNDNLQSIGFFNHKDFLGRDNLFPILTNYITGCSLCISGRVFKQFNFDVSKDDIPMHDWWIAIQAYFYSMNIFYDKKSTVLYRQHSGNVVGITSIYKRLFSLSFWKKRIESNIKIKQISLLDENMINDLSLLRLKKDVQDNHQNIIGRIKICKMYFQKASCLRWLLFIFLK